MLCYILVWLGCHKSWSDMERQVRQKYCQWLPNSDHWLLMFDFWSDYWFLISDFWVFKSDYWFFISDFWNLITVWILILVPIFYFKITDFGVSERTVWTSPIPLTNCQQHGPHSTCACARACGVSDLSCVLMYCLVYCAILPCLSLSLRSQYRTTQYMVAAVVTPIF